MTCTAFTISQVGSGKSSLLNSILGEMQLVNGSVYSCGSIAYVPQVCRLVLVLFVDLNSCEIESHQACLCFLLFEIVGPMDSIRNNP